MKTVVSVIGKDAVGITAKVSGLCGECNANILDITQTIIGGYFNMVTVVDITEAKWEFAVIAERLQEVGEEFGLEIKIQRAEIFDTMHRV